MIRRTAFVSSLRDRNTQAAGRIPFLSEKLTLLRASHRSRTSPDGWGRVAPGRGKSPLQRRHTRWERGRVPREKVQRETSKTSFLGSASSSGSSDLIEIQEGGFKKSNLSIWAGRLKTKHRTKCWCKPHVLMYLQQKNRSDDTVRRSGTQVAFSAPSKRFPKCI